MTPGCCLAGDGKPKGIYPSESRAREVAHKRMRDNKTLVLRPYFCGRCGHWHITGQPDRFKREDAA